MIAELRQQLYDLKNQDRDYRGVNDEIINSENRYKVLSDDKVRTQLFIQIGQTRHGVESQTRQRYGRDC